MQKPPFGIAPAVRVSKLIKAILPCVCRRNGGLDQRETVEGWLGRGSSSRPEQCSLHRSDSCPRESGAQCKEAFFSFIFLPQQKNELAREGRNPPLAGWHGKDGAATRPEEVGPCQLGYPCRAKQFAGHALPAFKGMFRLPRRPTFVSRRTKVGKKRLLSTAPAVRVSYLIKAGLLCVRHRDGCLDQRETVEGWLGRGSLVGAGRPLTSGTLFLTQIGFRLARAWNQSRRPKPGRCGFRRKRRNRPAKGRYWFLPEGVGSTVQRGFFFVYFFAPTKK